MKAFKLICVALGLAASAVGLHAQSPAALNNVFLNLTITGGTGTAATSGAAKSFLTSNNVDYTVQGNGTFSDPVPYTYTKTGANTGRIVEAAAGGLPSVDATLTFTSPTAGSFTVTYGNASTQTGTFTTVPATLATSLINASTRTTLAANGSAITGFVIAGTGPRRVLIRAVGPGLSGFGVGNPLANPSISVWKDGMMTAQNDDFGAGANVDTTLPAESARAGAFPLATGSKDAAIILTLDPGPYTALIRGGTTTETGEVLLEVYFLD